MPTMHIHARVGLIIVFMLALLPLNGLASAQGGDPFADAEAFIDGLMAAQFADGRIAGATVSIVHDGEIVFSKGYGHANIADDVPVDPATTMFRIGSITKLFTWTAVMQLVEAGEIDLEADINTYLDFDIPAPFGEPITMLDLMAHAAGFEDRSFAMNAGSVDTIASLGEWLATHIPAQVRPPGEFSAYSNYGVALAGYIVEHVSGVPYEQYIQTHILDPLGMAHTTAYQAVPEALAADASHGYMYNGELIDWPLLLFNINPAGGIFASAEDMARFMLAHLQDGVYDGARILDAETAQLMHTTHFQHDGRVSGFAHGFIEMHYGDLRMIGHGGDTELFHSMLGLFPEENAGFFVSYNSADGAALTGPFTDAFVEHFFAPEVAVAVADDTAGWPDVSGEYRMMRMTYTAVEKVAVLFGLNPPLTMVPAADGGLNIVFMGDSIYVAPVEPLVYRRPDTGEHLIFRQDDAGNITQAFIGNLPYSALEPIPPHEAAGLNFFLLVGGLLLLLSVLAAAVGSAWMNRYNRLTPPEMPRLARTARLLLIALAVAALLFLISFTLALLDLNILFTGQSLGLTLGAALSLLVLALTVAAAVFTALAWLRGWWRLGGRIHYTLVTLGAVGFVVFLHTWNLLGFRF